MILCWRIDHIIKDGYSLRNYILFVKINYLQGIISCDAVIKNQQIVRVKKQGVVCVIQLYMSYLSSGFLKEILHTLCFSTKTAAYTLRLFYDYNTARKYTLALLQNQRVYGVPHHICSTTVLILSSYCWFLGGRWT